MGKQLTLETIVEPTVDLKIGDEDYLLQTPNAADMMKMGKLVQHLVSDDNDNRIGTMLQFVMGVIRHTNGKKVDNDKVAKLLVATGGYTATNPLLKECMTVCGFGRADEEESETAKDEEDEPMEEEAQLFTE